jgi:Leucine-rich repeat (LRR) protein
LEKYLNRDPDSEYKAHQDQNRDTKLALLKRLIDLINTKPPEDPNRRDVIAAIFYYTAILLPDGRAGVPSEPRLLKITPLIDYHWIFFEKYLLIPDNTPDQVKTFVGTSLRTFVKRYHGVLDKDLKKQMLAAFKKTSISQNEVCFGDMSNMPERSWWKKWWVWLIAIIIGIILVMGLKSVSNKMAAKKQSAIVEQAIRSNPGMKEVELTDKVLGGVTELVLSDTELTDAGLKEVATKLKQLKVLNLNKTKITDEGLKELVRVQNLGTLFLDGTGITDEGLKELYELKRLKTLLLRNTKVTKKGVKELKDKLENCDIKHNAKK